MKRLLTTERLRELLRYDPDVGLFQWIALPSEKAKKAKVGNVAGCLDAGYIVITIDGQRYPAHHLAFLYMTGEWPKHRVDHRDLDRANNRWLNIRPATNSENQWNLPRRKRNRSGFKGVCWERQTSKYKAQVQANGVQKTLGRFDTAELAHAACVAYRVEHHGEFARHE
jgi:hypothetical protein